jgi:hypothetical protein
MFAYGDTVELLMMSGVTEKVAKSTSPKALLATTRGMKSRGISNTNFKS